MNMRTTAPSSRLETVVRDAVTTATARGLRDSKRALRSSHSSLYGERGEWVDYRHGVDLYVYNVGQARRILAAIEQRRAARQPMKSA